ncbi:MAG: hypothetical protein ABJC19_08785 [Gemmatimonadota bacterium]
MRAVFEGIVDYAGLFPPASLTMDDAVAAYSDYRYSPESWMLGRFVVSATRLAEFGASIDRLEAAVTSDAPWRVSAVLGAALPAELAAIDRFRTEWDRRGVLVDAIEHRVATVDQVQAVGASVPREYLRFLEFPPDGPHDELATASAAIGAYAKIRTGGTSPDLFPTPQQLTDFLVAVTSRSLPFKATAGLHHPLRGSFPLSYEPAAAHHPMYGFVNVLLATAELLRGDDGTKAHAILTELDPSTVHHEAGAITWRGIRYRAEELAAVRRLAFLGFGSCSFREPVEELHAMAVQ